MEKLTKKDKEIITKHLFKLRKSLSVYPKIKGKITNVRPLQEMINANLETERYISNFFNILNFRLAENIGRIRTEKELAANKKKG